ncbi:hypothetical protein ACQJBY_043685 [Aegilops geniculata]
MTHTRAHTGEGRICSILSSRTARARRPPPAGVERRPSRPPSSPCCTALVCLELRPRSVHGRLDLPPNVVAVGLLTAGLPEPPLQRYAETDAAAVIDYVDDDPSSLSPELPDGGSLEPDATADGYYYVKVAEDQE